MYWNILKDYFGNKILKILKDCEIMLILLDFKTFFNYFLQSGF